MAVSCKTWNSLEDGPENEEVLGLPLKVPSKATLGLKRVFDLVLLLLVGPPGFLIVALSALLVRLKTGGSSIYRQSRVGLHGEVFDIWKIRTMLDNADEVLEQHLESNDSAREEWNQYFKLRKDPRIIPYLGSVLRRSSLDELPQLLNVLRGEMSFVGPRPLPPYHFRCLSLEFQKRRQCVPPGLTGLWQINERSDGDVSSHEKWDSRYIESFSLLTDLKILLKTPLVVIMGRGAR